MPDFLIGHASSPHWETAARAVLAQFEQIRGPIVGDRIFDAPHQSPLGVVYVTEALASHLAPIIAELRRGTRIDAWSGAVGRGVCATGLEFTAEPAMVVMTANLPKHAIQLFPNLQMLARLSDSSDDDDARHMSAERLAAPRTSGLMMHVDGQTLDFAVQVADARNLGGSDQAFGAVIERGEVAPSQFAGEAVANGLSGVRFLEPIRLFSRIAQGSIALGPEHVVTNCSPRHLVALDGRPALDVMLADLQLPESVIDLIDGDNLLQSLQLPQLRRGLFIGIAPAEHRPDGRFDDSFQVRRLTGVDPRNRMLGVSPLPRVGDRIVFCTRDNSGARASLVRVCAELREELESEGRAIRAAFYHGCPTRNRQVFGGPGGSELELIRRHLGPVPLIGLYADNQIAGGQVHEYSSVLTVIA